MKYQEIKKIMLEELGVFFNNNQWKIMEFNGFGFYLEKKNEKYVNRTGFRKIIKAKGPQYTGGGLAIVLNEVEEILFPFILKHKLWDTVQPPTEFSITLADMSHSIFKRKMYEKIDSIIISTHSHVVEYCKVLQEYLKEYAIPWFNKYSSVAAANDLINELSMKESFDCFAAPFPTQLYRQMIITEKCGNRERTLQTRDNCLNRFKRRRIDGSSDVAELNRYEKSFADLCGMLKIPTS